MVQRDFYPGWEAPPFDPFTAIQSTLEAGDYNDRNRLRYSHERISVRVHAV